MKNKTRGILFCLVALAMSGIYGGQEPSGVAAVNVTVKQDPDKLAVTDAISGRPKNLRKSA